MLKFSFGGLNRRTKINLIVIGALALIAIVVIVSAGESGGNFLTGATSFCVSNQITSVSINPLCATATPTQSAAPSSKPTPFMVNGCMIMPATQCPGANLSNANLTSAQLVGANLTGANLSLANLTSANLSLSKLTNAVWLATNLSYANLKGSTGADLTGAHLCKTILPDGSSSDRDCAIPIGDPSH